MTTSRKTTPENPVQESSFDVAARDRALAMLNAPAWRPADGEVLTGRLVQIRKQGTGSEFGAYPVLIFEPVDGIPFPSDAEYLAFHAFHTVVIDRLGELRPRPADQPVMTVKHVGRITFGQTVMGADGEPVYVKDDKKSDYVSYTVLMGDGSDIDVDSFDWDNDRRPDARKGDK